jgi:hypothetical protein
MAYHDVVPYECLPPEFQGEFHNGYELQASFIGDSLSKVLAENGMDAHSAPPREGFDLTVENEGTTHNMPVHVVNVVNTSYWEMNRYTAAHARHKWYHNH